MEVHYIHFSKIDSTHTWAKTHLSELSSAEPQKITCITADEQTQAYGRQARPWVSKKGNLQMTLCFALPLLSPLLPNLAQILAFSLAEILLEIPIALEIKWPNDLLFKGGKFGGAMAEYRAQENSTGVLLSMGVNVNAPIVTDQKTSSLCEITSSLWDLTSLRNRLVTQFQKNLALLSQKGFAYFQPAFASLLAYKNQPIICHVGDKSIEGTLQGLTPEGQLQIHCSDGTTRNLLSGDITHLRPNEE